MRPVSAGQAQAGQRSAVTDRDELPDGLVRAEGGRARGAERGAEVVEHRQRWSPGPIRQGARAGRGAPESVSRLTASTMLAGSPSEAGTTGTDSRDASRTAATPAALAACSPMSARTTTPRPSAEMLRPVRACLPGQSCVGQPRVQGLGDERVRSEVAGEHGRNRRLGG